MSQFKVKFLDPQQNGDDRFLDADGRLVQEGTVFPNLLAAHEAASKFCVDHPPTDKLEILGKETEEAEWDRVGYI